MVFPTFLYLLLFSQVQMLNCLVYSLDLFIIALHSTLVIYGAQFTLTYHFLKGAYTFKTLIHSFPMHPFSTPLSTKTLRFSDVFRVQRKAALVVYTTKPFSEVMKNLCQTFENLIILKLKL